MADIRGRFDHNMSARNGRSLLGLDDDTNKRLLYAEETEDVFDRETEMDLEKLGEKVSTMKNIGSEIEIEISRSMREVDNMTEGFSQVQSALDASFNRLKELKNTAKTRHMCYLILFIVVVFLVLYLIFV